MYQPHSPVRREGAAREGILDRKAVLMKLQNWLDTVMPATALNVTHTIKVEPFPAASPKTRDGNAERDGNVANDIHAPKSSSRDGASSAAAARAAPPSIEKPDEFERPEIVVIFDGPDKELLLERGAELLLALEYLAVRSLRLEPPFFDRIRFDSGDFRSLRIAELMLSAKVAAQRVRETKQPFRLNPMAPRERRIVHLALKDLAGIRTTSEGVGEERQVVILPIPEPRK
jgi:predicted RNA-binding protein Jag